jgi:hypothetical protein
MRKTNLLLLPALVAIALSACSKSPEERIAEAAIGAMTGKDVSVDKDGEKVTFGSGDQAVTISGGDSAELPAGFPKDVWLPGDYTVESAMASTGFTMVAMRADGTIADFAAQARQRMEAGGWKRTMETQDETSSMLAYENAERTALLAFDRHDEGGVAYSVQVSAKQQPSQQ